MNNKNINTETSTELPSCLQPTISLCDLTLADWLAIAHASGARKEWAFLRWTYASSLLESLSLEEWEMASEQAGYDKSFGHLYYQHFSKDRSIDQA